MIDNAPANLVQWQRSSRSLAPLDFGFDYLRQRGGSLLGLYVASMTPMTLVVLFLIDAIDSGDRTAMATGCRLVVPACLWRWSWLALLQRRVQRDLRGDEPLPLRRRLLIILFVRLMAAVLLTWGSFLVIPGFYGILLGSMATPLLLETPGDPWQQVLRLGGWINDSLNRLIRMFLALSLALLLFAGAVLVLHVMLLTTVLSSLLDLNTAELALTFTSAAWIMAMLYGLFILFDFYWTATSVMVFYDIQSRRLGGDLRLRLQVLRGAAP